VIQSGPSPRRAIAAASSSAAPGPPITSFTPTGFPPVSRMRATQSSIPSTESNIGKRFGESMVRPACTRRMPAISSVTLAPSRCPPRILAPWWNFSSMPRTGPVSALRRNSSQSHSPACVRTPKSPGPIWNTTSPPPTRWCGESPPSPVFIHVAPATARPWESAWMAWRPSEPYDMALIPTSPRSSQGCGSPSPSRSAQASGSVWGGRSNSSSRSSRAKSPSSLIR
jgi:hypothetical protein